MKNIKVAAILLKHGINPFLPVYQIKGKLQSRLTVKEKDWIIEHGVNKNYLKSIFYEE